MFIVVIASSVAMGALVTYAQTKMKVHLKSGQQLSFGVDSVTKMTFTPAIRPYYSVMRVFSRGTIPNPVEIATDTMTFQKGSGQRDLLAITGWDWKFRVLGIDGIDSITFIDFKVNTDVVQISPMYWDPHITDSNLGNFHASVWSGNQLFCSGPIVALDVNDSNIVTRESTLFSDYGPLFIAKNPKKRELLAVLSSYPDVSIGWLAQFSIDSGTLTVIDSGRYNSSAAYMPGTDSLIYYTYGSYSSSNTHPADAGYYFLNSATNARTLLLHYISDLGPGEMVNGFDVSPDGKKLLIASASAARPPFVIEYNLALQTFDTLLRFNSEYPRWALWLRYNHDGSKILYGNYPIGSFAHSSVGDSSEVGIIDRQTFTKRVLNTNPNNQSEWISVFPEWSPNEDKIVYGSGPIFTEPPGAVGSYQICILKTLQ